MHGLNRQTGTTVSGEAWLEQQIIDILTTTKTTRTMRANYGANLQQFVDRNTTAQLSIDIVAEAGRAMIVLKSVFELQSIRATHGNSQGQMLLDIVGISLVEGNKIQLAGVLIA